MAIQQKKALVFSRAFFFSTFGIRSLFDCCLHFLQQLNRFIESKTQGGVK